MRCDRIVGATLLLVLTACGTAAPSASTDPWQMTGPVRELPPDIERAEGRRGPNGGTLLEPSTVQIAEGVPYQFALGHCGLLSPVDLDGSFWTAVEGFDADGRAIDLATDSEMINATSGVVAVVGDEARFRTGSGTVVRFARVVGGREFPACA